MSAYALSTYPILTPQGHTQLIKPFVMTFQQAQTLDKAHHFDENVVSK